MTPRRITAPHETVLLRATRTAESSEVGSPVAFEAFTEGRELPSSEVTIRTHRVPDGFLTRTWNGASGRLDDGTYRVTGTWRDMEAVPFEVEIDGPPSEPIRVEFRARSIVAGRVFGLPSSATVILDPVPSDLEVGDSLAPSPSSFGKASLFRFEVQPGPYRLAILDQNRVLATRRLDVVPGFNSVQLESDSTLKPLTISMSYPGDAPQGLTYWLGTKTAGQTNVDFRASGQRIAGSQSSFELVLGEPAGAIWSGSEIGKLWLLLETQEYGQLAVPIRAGQSIVYANFQNPAVCTFSWLPDDPRVTDSVILLERHNGSTRPIRLKFDALVQPKPMILSPGTYTLTTGRTSGAAEPPSRVIQVKPGRNHFEVDF